ncbi:MAG: hypothetical protein RLZZ563_2592, partial [Pseudomonadota bacterium]
FAHLPESWKPQLRADTDLRRMLETKPAAWVEFLPFHCEFYRQALCLAAQTDVVCSHWLVPTAVIGHAVSRKRNLPHVPLSRITLWRRAALLRLAMIYALTAEPRATITALIQEAS